MASETELYKAFKSAQTALKEGYILVKFLEAEMEREREETWVRENEPQDRLRYEADGGECRCAERICSGPNAGEWLSPGLCMRYQRPSNNRSGPSFASVADWDGAAVYGGEGDDPGDSGVRSSLGDRSKRGGEDDSPYSRDSDGGDGLGIFHGGLASEIDL